MNMARTHQQSGFTLLEVLVALTVLAVAAAGLIGAIRQNVSQQSTLEDKTLGMWVAQNKMAVLHANHVLPPLGITTETTTMADRQWEIKTTITAAPASNLAQIEIDVSRSQKTPASPAASLIGFMGRY